jgi:hypothetical protein
VDTILHVHAVMVQLNLNGLPDHLVHVSVFGGEDTGVLELHLMVLTYAAFGHS